MFDETQLLDDLSEPLPVTGTSSAVSPPIVSPLPTTTTTPTSTAAATSNARGNDTIKGSTSVVGSSNNSSRSGPTVPGAVRSLRQALAGRDTTTATKVTGTKIVRPPHDSTMPLGVLGHAEDDVSDSDDERMSDERCG